MAKSISSVSRLWKRCLSVPVFAPGMAAALSGKVAVSPGEVRGTALLIGEACPTFSWVEGECTDAYEIVGSLIPRQDACELDDETFGYTNLPGGFGGCFRRRMMPIGALSDIPR